MECAKCGINVNALGTRGGPGPKSHFLKYRPGTWLFFDCMEIPKYLLTDQDTHFISKLMSDLCQILQVKYLRMSVYHPQTDRSIYPGAKQYSVVNGKWVWRNWDLLLTEYSMTQWSSPPSSVPILIPLTGATGAGWLGGSHSKTVYREGASGCITSVQPSSTASWVQAKQLSASPAPQPHLQVPGPLTRHSPWEFGTSELSPYNNWINNVAHKSTWMDPGTEERRSDPHSGKDLMELVDQISERFLAEPGLTHLV